MADVNRCCADRPGQTQAPPQPDACATRLMATLFEGVGQAPSPAPG